MPVADIRAVADVVIAVYASFGIDHVDGRLVDDTAVLFGDYALGLADGSTTAGVFTFTFVRFDGSWKTLLTHYTPTTGSP